jgi:hypothetical protein
MTESCRWGPRPLTWCMRTAACSAETGTLARRLKLPSHLLFDRIALADVNTCLGKGLNRHITERDHPLVVLFGEGRADKMDDAARLGKIPTSVRRRTSLLRRSSGLLDLEGIATFPEVAPFKVKHAFERQQKVSIPRVHTWVSM